ncbi:MFS transporter [Roseomonas sp. NAR14]|uniref:MFS transporter n=1 Tax=Roseomonas acroporae TaxID=2937791 RepID=A0A9X1Y997_9PROT|nr:MFS transporter [Roseomonas acroporae]MCK8785440.1 MFS transporter [Roseomonas acroporae]
MPSCTTIRQGAGPTTGETQADAGAQASHAAASQPAAGATSFFTIFPSIMLPMFLAVIDQTIVATALPAIAASLGGVERLSWVVVSYLVATTIAAPVYGRLGDALGRRRMMLVALAIFMLFSALCATARSVEMLSFLRVLQGLGGGGLMTLSQALIGEALPPRERARYQGYLAAVAVCSSTFGPVAGGFLAEHLGWRSIFLVNLPVGALAMLLTLRLPRRGGTGGSLRFDTLGLVLFVLFVAPMLLALTLAQRLDFASLPAILGLVALSCCSCLLLLRQERRAAMPLLPLRLLRQPTIWRADGMAMFHGAALVALFTFLPMYLRVVRGASATETGLLLLPLAAGIGIGSMLTGRLVARTGRTAVFPTVGLAVATLTLLCLALFAGRFSLPALVTLLGVNAIFMGTVMGVVQVTVQTAAPPRAIGAAAGSVQFSRAVGAAFGTALVGAVLFAALSLTDPLAAALFNRLVREGPAVMATLSTAQQVLVRDEIAGAFSAAFVTIAAFTGAGLALAATLPMRRLP